MSRRTVKDIDENLKAAFNEVANQEIPEELVELLKKLRAAEKASKSKEAGNGEDD